MTMNAEQRRAFLLALDEDPEFYETLRGKVLGRELLETPAVVQDLSQRFAALTEQMNGLAEQVAILTRRVDELTQLVRDYILATNERLDRIEAGQANIIDRVNAVNGRVDRIEAGQANIIDRVNAVNGRVGLLTGAPYERYIAGNARSLAMTYLGLSQVDVLHSAIVVNRPDLEEILYHACAAHAISLQDSLAATRADVIMRGQDAEGRTAYAVLEVSETAHTDDVSRARARADILARATGAPTIAAAVGQTATAETLAFAADRRVIVIQA